MAALRVNRTNFGRACWTVVHYHYYVDYSQSWTALFRAFSSHRQPSAEDSWGLPMRAKSSKQRCPALCILDLSYNVKYHWSCRIGGCYGHLTASGSWHGFPGVDHEGRQDVAMLIIIMLVVGRWCYFADDVGYFQGWLCCVLSAQV